MKLDPFELGYDGFKFWREHSLGKKLTRKLFPKIMARRDAKRGIHLPKESYMPDKVTVILPDGSQIEREEPLIAARTSTKSGAVALAAPIAALATIMPFYPQIDGFLQKVCTSDGGPTRALIIFGATWVVTAIPAYITARFTKSPIIKKAL